MVKRALGILATVICLSQPSFAGVSAQGALSYGFFNRVSAGSGARLSSALLELKGGTGPAFNVAVGSLLLPTVAGDPLKNGANFATNGGGSRFGLLWGYLKIPAPGGFELSVGELTTNVGAELPATYSNPNVQFGLLWRVQPFIYKGVRLSKEEGPLNLYTEYDWGKGLGSSDSRAFGAGVGFNLSRGELGLNYFSVNGYKRMLDAVYTLPLSGGFSVTLNADYQWLVDSPSKRGEGVALYLTASGGAFSLPLRFEVVNEEAGSNIYGLSGGRAVSVTVTPTFKLNGWSELRLEVSEVSASRPAFNGKSEVTSVAVEFTACF
ncbi:outer membrane beta-barrel protein [Thermovibrio ammonificans]